MEELRRTFRPEFLNRLDEIVLFHSLGRKELSRIVEIMMREVNDRLAGRKIAISLTPAATARIAEIGFDPAYGARPLRRAIQKRIEDALAMRILEGEVREGDRVTVDVDPESGFTFTREG
jgi:ATP-dependent Clp protease ATP-binding subunit ClpA